MFYSDDPIADFAAYEAEQARQLEKLPICSNCGERITSEYCYEIDGGLICQDCLESDYRHCTDNYVG